MLGSWAKSARLPAPVRLVLKFSRISGSSGAIKALKASWIKWPKPIVKTCPLWKCSSRGVTSVAGGTGGASGEVGEGTVDVVIA